jgi:hypothetical protein
VGTRRLRPDSLPGHRDLRQYGHRRRLRWHCRQHSRYQLQRQRTGDWRVFEWWNYYRLQRNHTALHRSRHTCRCGANHSNYLA